MFASKLILQSVKINFEGYSLANICFTRDISLFMENSVAPSNKIPAHEALSVNPIYEVFNIYRDMNCTRAKFDSRSTVLQYFFNFN